MQKYFVDLWNGDKSLLQTFWIWNVLAWGVINSLIKLSTFNPFKVRFMVKGKLSLTYMLEDWPVNSANSSKLSLSKFLNFSSSNTYII